jgi:hypothetical protein
MGKALFTGGRCDTLCRRYTLSLPVSVLVCGIQSRANHEQDLAIARGFQPLSKPEIAELLSATKEPAADGHVEQYKVGNFGCDWHHQNPPEKRT